MKEALLYQKLARKTVRCEVCQHRCLIKNGQRGYCQTRLNKNGKLYSLIYGVVSSINLDPIEKKPVYHFQPGSMCLSLGSYGCNFRCQFCQNWSISHVDFCSLNLKKEKYLSPKKVVQMAKKMGAAGIAWTYNEPAIWLEYSLAGAKLAKDVGLYTCWVTNGYATKEAIDLIGPYLDIYRVDIKSTEKKFFEKLIGPIKPEGILEITKYVHDKYPKIHIECVTNIIPDWNDNRANLKYIALWIKKSLGSKTPWHVTRFFPFGELNDIPPTPMKTLLKAQKIGQKAGLKFIHLGNV